MTHEEVRGHDHGHILDSHLVFLFIVYYSLEKFEQGLQRVPIRLRQQDDEEVQGLELLLLGRKTLDRLEGLEVLSAEQRQRQLADQQLQQAGGVVLLDAVPGEGPFVKLCLQFLAKVLDPDGSSGYS